MDTAYVNFFRGNLKFPVFKSRKKKNTFTVPQFTELKENILQIPKFKQGIKTIVHRQVKGEIGKCTFSRSPTGKYFVSILSEEQYDPTQKTGKISAIDLGIKDFAVTSDGIKFRNNKYTNQYERKLAQAQKFPCKRCVGFRK